jgi:hypothetical protein
MPEIMYTRLQEGALPVWYNKGVWKLVRRDWDTGEILVEEYQARKDLMKALGVRRNFRKYFRLGGKTKTGDVFYLFGQGVERKKRLEPLTLPVEDIVKKDLWQKPLGD